MNDHEFDADLCYLRSLADFMFDTLPASAMPWPSGPTVEQRLVMDMSTDARHAIGESGWTIDIDWERPAA